MSLRHFFRAFLPLFTLLSPVPRFSPNSADLKRFKPFLPLLVAGVPGVPGYNAFLFFHRLFPGLVHGLVPEHSDLPAATFPEPPAPSGLIRLNPEDKSAIQALFAQGQYRSVIDASGWCALKAAELDPLLARRLNLDIGLHLMEAARNHGARLIRLSSDLVFSGSPRDNGQGGMILGAYRETDAVSPVTVYGKVMAEAERRIRAGLPETWVLRVSLPMGPSANAHAGAIDWIDSRFRRTLPATLYYDEVRTPIYAQDLNALLAELLVAGPAPREFTEGLLHVGGPRSLSLNQIAQVVNVAGDYDSKLLMGCFRHAAGPMPPRAGDVTMNFGKLAQILPQLEVRPWPLISALAPAGHAWHRMRAGLPQPLSIERDLFGYARPAPLADPPPPGEALPWDHPVELLKSWKAI